MKEKIIEFLTNLTGCNKGDVTSGGATIASVIVACYFIFVPLREYNAQIAALKVENKHLRNDFANVCNTLGAQGIFVPIPVETEETTTNIAQE